MARTIAWVLLVGAVVAVGGCPTSSPESGEFTRVDSAVMDAPFVEVWQSTKAVLRQQEYLIYTRDKRGIFVAYSDQKRKFLTPHRTQVTINLEELTAETTRLTIETAYQEYGVTLLTYPGWHIRESDDDSKALAILEGVRQHLAAGPESPEAHSS